MAEPAEPELMMISLDRIEPSPHNPRKTFEDEPLQQLAKSIREKGVLEPIIVRPRGHWVAHLNDLGTWYAATPRGKSGELNTHDPFTGADAEARCRKHVEEKNRKAGYELIAGERRWRASKLAGLKIIPAIVRDLDDKAAAEVAVIENDQREDVPPLEQAEGYARLVELGDDAEAIATKIGRPVKYVAGRLQLTKLTDELKEDLRSGKLPFGHALLLSRLTPAEQARVRDEDLYEYDDTALPLDHLRRAVRQSAVADLSAAPWKKDDATLTAAGPCTTCPRRHGSNPTLFDELLGAGDQKKGRDFCTDPACFREKQEAFLANQVRKATVDAGGVAPVLVSLGYYTRGKDVLTADRYEVVPPKEAKKAPPGELRPAVIAQGSQGDLTQDVGKIVQVRLKKDAPAGRGNTSGDSDYDREQRKREQRQKLYRAAALKANGLVAAKVYAVVGSPDGGAAAVAMLRQLAAALTGCGGADACRAVVKRRGLEKVKAAYGGMDATRGPVRELASQLDSARDLLGLIAEVLAAHESERWCFSHYSGAMDAGEKAFWAAFGVDRAKLVREVEAETKGPGVLAKRDKVAAKRDRNKKLAAIAAPKKAARKAKVTA